MPQEYRDAQKYINSLSGEKIYFPHTVPYAESLSLTNAYTWGQPQYKNSVVLYKNPFTSLVPVNDLVQFERFPYILSPQWLELRYLTDYEKPLPDIIKALELRGIRYIIFDDNFKWSRYIPKVDKQQLFSLTSLEKRIGNIYILKLKDKTADCKKSYGDISVEYCNTPTKPQVLINKTSSDLLLEIQPTQFGKKLEIRRNSKYVPNIQDPKLHQLLIQEKLLFGKDILQIFGNQEDIFSINRLSKGTYHLFIPLFKIPQAIGVFEDAQIDIQLNGKTIQTLDPYAACSGFVWEKVTIPVTQDNTLLTIDIKNKGYVILGSTPIILNDRELIALEKENKTDIRTLIQFDDKEVTFTKRPVITVNELSTQLSCPKFEVNLLNDRLLKTSGSTLSKLNNVVTGKYGTKEGKYTLQYTIENNTKWNRLQVIIGAYYFEVRKTAFVEILKDNKSMYRSELIDKDLHPNIIDIPKDVLSAAGSQFILKIYISDEDLIQHDGIHFYKLFLTGDVIDE
jgi:hypothetical protein